MSIKIEIILEYIIMCSNIGIDNFKSYLYNVNSRETRIFIIPALGLGFLFLVSSSLVCREVLLWQIKTTRMWMP